MAESRPFATEMVKIRSLAHWSKFSHFGFSAPTFPPLVISHLKYSDFCAFYEYQKKSKFQNFPQNSNFQKFIAPAV